jgi:hypothetical protein
LNDLETSDPLLPPDADAARTLEVVPVHNNVDQEVERDRHPRHGRHANELSIAEKSCGTVVVAVQESWNCQYLARSCGS